MVLFIIKGTGFLPNVKLLTPYFPKVLGNLNLPKRRLTYLREHPVGAFGDC